MIKVIYRACGSHMLVEKSDDSPLLIFKWRSDWVDKTYKLGVYNMIARIFTQDDECEPTNFQIDLITEFIQNLPLSLKTT